MARGTMRAMSRTPSFVLAVVLAAATLACSPREERNSDRVDEEGVALDQNVLDQLRAAGSDLSKPHQIDFYLYLPSQADAEAAGAVLRPMGYDVTVSVGDNDINWRCLASRKMKPTIQELTVARGVFKGLALRYQGAYDGWVTAIER
jgi:hypothetical protein